MLRVTLLQVLGARNFSVDTSKHKSREQPFQTSWERLLCGQCPLLSEGILGHRVTTPPDC